MHHKIFALAIVLLCTSLLVSCNKKKDEFNESLSGIQTVENISPDPMLVGKSRTIKVQFSATNGCGEFNRFVENWINDYTVEIRAYVRYPKGETICTTAIKTLEANYEFKPSKTGVFKVKFFAEKTFIERQIVVV